MKIEQQNNRAVNQRLLLRCCAAALLLCLALSSSVHAAEIIQKIDIEGLHSMKTGELLDILNIRIGDVFSPSSVRSGIKLAFLKGIFEDISVKVDDKDRSHILVKVRERDVIRKIIITGNQRLPKKTIKNHFSLKEEDVMRYDRMEGAVKELKTALHERGFPNVDIKLAIEKTDTPYRVNLLLAVNEGMPEIIKSIKIIGPAETRELLKIEEGDVYDRVAFKKEIERIRLHYKKENFFKPAVGPYVFRDGNLEINIDPGKKLEIVFENNSVLNSETLTKETPFFEAEDFRDDLVEEAVSRIVFLYHSKGFPYVQVAPVITSNKDTITARFFIFEGDRKSVV